MFREGNENYKMKSHGRARKNEANSRENSRDREFSLVSGGGAVAENVTEWVSDMGQCKEMLLKPLRLSQML